MKTIVLTITVKKTQELNHGMTPNQWIVRSEKHELGYLDHDLEKALAAVCVRAAMAELVETEKGQ